MRELQFDRAKCRQPSVADIRRDSSVNRAVLYILTSLINAHFLHNATKLALLPCVDKQSRNYGIIRVHRSYKNWNTMQPDAGHSIDAHSRRPLDRLQLKYIFALCDPVTLTFDLWPFDLKLNRYPELMTDYTCGKFGDCSFSRFGSNVQTDRHTQTRMNALSPVSTTRVDGPM